MKDYSALVSFIVVSCLVVTSAGIGYYKRSDDSNLRSSFFLPYLAQGSIITALIDVHGASIQYNVELWKPLSYPPNSPDEFVVLSGGGTYKSNPLSIAGSWRIVISPLYSTSAQFQFTISFSANNLSIGKYADIARHSRIFILYHNSAGKKSIKLSVPSSFAGQATPYLYGPFQSLAVAGGIPISSDQSVPSLVLNYETKGK